MNETNHNPTLMGTEIRGKETMSNGLIQISTPITQKAGKKYWRSLDELADTKEFRDWVSKEFPGGTDMLSGASRRNVLKIMAASFGLAGLAACRRPIEHILPASKGIEDFIPGKAYFYATVFQHAGEAMGVLVEAHDGRPTKIEGNPDHPYSLGRSSALAQASLLNLYDPDRAQKVTNGGVESTWEYFTAYVNKNFSKSALGSGQDVRFLSTRIISPSYQAVKAEALKALPQAKWVEYDPFAQENILEGTKIAFGQPLTVHYAFDKANVVLTLENDFLGVDSGTVRQIKQWSSGRHLSEESKGMNRLYAVESRQSITGTNADHRLRLRSSQIPAFVTALSGALEGQAPSGDQHGKWIAAIAKDLKANPGKSIVLAGPNQPPAVHALVFAINQSLGNIGQTISFTKPVYDTTNSGVAALKSLVDEINAGTVKKLVILGGNPAYTAPYDLHLGDAIKKVGSTIFVGADVNETAVLAQWTVPEAHYLESWGDAAAVDGTASIQQPLIQPLWGGKTQLEIVALLTGYKDQTSYDIVANYWKTRLGGSDAKKAWEKSLNDGVIATPKEPEVKVSVDAGKVKAAAAALSTQSAPGLEVVFYPDYSVYDGSYANNGWMQELPDPVTKVVWDNAALLSHQTMTKLGLIDGQIVNLKRGNFIVEMPVMVQPGHADDSVTVLLGYGREQAGRVGKGVGFNGYPLRTTAAYTIATDIALEKTDKSEQLVSTQDHNSMEGRSVVAEASLDEYTKNPKVFSEGEEEGPVHQLYEPPAGWQLGVQWGMSIDLTACIGCHACAVACQAENNIPVVGKLEVSHGRNMLWIRIDRYYTGDIDEAAVVHSPIPCMQCENAPCENVCPVDATVHSPEGLNDMTYNRCVGTRYCLNNCPYKVRRFNFLNWHRHITEVEEMHFNPDVTVRMRGVMEKCTYCVQRIQEAKIRAKLEGHRAIKDGEIQTACQQTCPADAIVFGDVANPESRVSKLKQQERNYGLLTELDTRPRTTYLAKIRNTNPELA